MQQSASALSKIRVLDLRPGNFAYLLPITHLIGSNLVEDHGEPSLHTKEVVGSIPTAPTMKAVIYATYSYSALLVSRTSTLNKSCLPHSKWGKFRKLRSHWTAIAR